MAKKPSTRGTPAIEALEASTVDFEVLTYDAEALVGDYGHRVADRLGLNGDVIFKTLLVETPDRKFATAVIPVSKHLDLKAFAKVLGVKKIALASAQDAQRRTGYVIGGISPLGQKQETPTYIDASAQTLPQMIISGGQRGISIKLSPLDLLSATGGSFTAIATSTF